MLSNASVARRLQQVALPYLKAIFWFTSSTSLLSNSVLSHRWFGCSLHWVGPKIRKQFFLYIYIYILFVFCFSLSAISLVILTQTPGEISSANISNVHVCAAKNLCERYRTICILMNMQGGYNGDSC